jgi:hypothetical protein
MLGSSGVAAQPVASRVLFFFAELVMTYGIFHIIPVFGLKCMKNIMKTSEYE